MARLQRRKENVADLSPAVKLLNFLSLERLCRNTCNLIDVMLSKAKHLAFSRCYKVEILRLRPQNDIATQPPTGEERGEGAKFYYPSL